MDDELDKRGPWEGAWQKALDEPSITPPGRLWQGLENSLMEQQLSRYKRRLALYQGLAAASVVLLGLWTGWWLIVGEPSLNQNRQPHVATEQTAPPQPATTATALPPVPAGQSLAGAGVDQGISAARLQLASRALFSYTPLAFSPAAPALRGHALASPFYAGSGAGVGLRPFYSGSGAEQDQVDTGALPLSPGLLTAIKAELALQQPQPNVQVQGVALAAAPAVQKSKPRPMWQSNGSMWLGASLASTLFSPNISSDNMGMSYLQNQQPVGKDGQVYSANMGSWNAKENSLPSVDFRLDAGYRFRPRWMLHTSLQYANYRVNTLAGSFVSHEDGQSYPLYYSNFSYDKLQLTSPNSRRAIPVEVINTYSFVRVPVALNYVVYERALGVALSGGLSADVFMGSRIADQDSRLEEFEISAGQDSPFNRLHLSGQLGLQLYYRAGHNYLLTLEPSYRHALSDFSKSGGFFNSRPSHVGIAAGFRFILR
ncbi:hypothetical protein [Cesiribacter andamanensis]|uniref:Outer membrane protein beta-barrel domain-containing protein n=1 Tax=Cesiribacter andamanensis AMV16 TaxID=1279009 RepID=M7N2Y3_9BACT|nr:hypothetical protein [Cesiribacter andamanensis]EMR01647.1 hypothetical protein ADICEAN_03221 [Cesiribacter andamanensis AMV16]